MHTFIEELNSGSEDDEEDHPEMGTKSDDKRLTAVNLHYEERIRGMEADIQAGKHKLQEEKGMAEAERQRLSEDLKRKEDELRKSRSEHEKLIGKLTAIEKKLIVGGENMLEKAEKQAALLAQSNRYVAKISFVL